MDELKLALVTLAAAQSEHSVFLHTHLTPTADEFPVKVRVMSFSRHKTTSLLVQGTF